MLAFVVASLATSFALLVAVFAADLALIVVEAFFLGAEARVEATAGVLMRRSGGLVVPRVLAIVDGGVEWKGGCWVKMSGEMMRA